MPNVVGHTAVTNAKWADAAHSAIECLVTFELDDGSTEVWPYGASQTDDAPWGAAIWAAALALGPAPYVAPVSAPPSPPTPILYGCAYGITVQDYDFQGLGDGSHIAAGLYLDVGQYLFYLDAEIANLRYFPKIWDGGTGFEITDKTASSFSVTARNGTGAAIDPAAFNIEIVRLI